MQLTFKKDPEACARGLCGDISKITVTIDQPFGIGSYVHFNNKKIRDVLNSFRGSVRFLVRTVINVTPVISEPEERHTGISVFREAILTESNPMFIYGLIKGLYPNYQKLMTYEKDVRIIEMLCKRFDTIPFQQQPLFRIENIYLVQSREFLSAKREDNVFVWAYTISLNLTQLPDSLTSTFPAEYIHDNKLVIRMMDARYLLQINGTSRRIKSNLYFHKDRK